MAFTWLATSACEKSLARKARPSTLLKFSGEHQKFSELILVLFAVDNLADTSLGVVVFLIYLVFLVEHPMYAVAGMKSFMLCIKAISVTW